MDDKYGRYFELALLVCVWYVVNNVTYNVKGTFSQTNLFSLNI